MTFDNPGYLFDGTSPSPTPPPPPVLGAGIGKSGGNVILDAVKQGEIISFPFDFTSSLAAGETISSAVAGCTVWSGYDLAPSELISPSPTIANGVVYQPVIGGAEGNIYVVSMIANTSLGQKLEQDAFITVV